MERASSSCDCSNGVESRHIQILFFFPLAQKVGGWNQTQKLSDLNKSKAKGETKPCHLLVRVNHNSWLKKPGNFLCDI